MNATASDATHAPARLLTTNEVAARLGVHPVTVREWVRSGALASLRLGNRTRRVSEQDLAAFLRERREGRAQIEEGGDV